MISLIFFSHISAVSLLAIPVEVYQYGTQYAACVFTSLITCVLISIVYLPVFYQLQLTSTFEYLELRFTRPVRTFASFLYTLSTVIYVPLIVYVPSLAFSQATAIDLYLITPIICIVCIFYTTIVSYFFNYLFLINKLLILKIDKVRSNRSSRSCVYEFNIFLQVKNLQGNNSLKYLAYLHIIEKLRKILRFLSLSKYTWLLDKTSNKTIDQQCVKNLWMTSDRL